MRMSDRREQTLPTCIISFVLSLAFDAVHIVALVGGHGMQDH